MEWELAIDERFRQIERRGRSTAAPRAAHSVHVELSGLSPGREYFYRFRAAGHLSPVGRTRTAPAPEAWDQALTMCFVSCSQYEHGWFTAYRRLAAEHPDVILHLGDYQYEYAPGPLRRAQRQCSRSRGAGDDDAGELSPALRAVQDGPRFAGGPHGGTVAGGLRRPRGGQQLGRGDAGTSTRAARISGPAGRGVPGLLREHAAAPILAAARRRHAALPARALGRLGDVPHARHRQYRGDQPCGDRFTSDCPERTDPARSITGAQQEGWLLDGFQRSRARWDLLGQQVFFSQVDLAPGPGRAFNPDSWDGYTDSRDRIVAGLRRSPVRNAVVPTGDIHSHWAAEVRERFDDPSSASVATELVTSSITSDGDGSETRPEITAILAENPHIRFFNNRRGYVRTRITPGELRADFQVVPFVSRRGAEVQTRASFVVPDREPALHTG